ncbi:SDR family NAD(P)-dependent oxidoreductase [Psychromonas sp.]|uniref:SDR family NAD(P)-dependent oxidoreductase n=1 Tax=Psychromonas sp. TaxID=1884585 RepID=UPI003A970781
MTDKKDQWALITGALGGIGKALVNEYVDAGYSVFALDVKTEGSECFNTEYVKFIQIDLEKVALDQTYSLEFYNKIKSISREHPIHCLVNNAAVQILAPSNELTREQWMTSLNVNLMAPFFLSQLFLSDLEKNFGSIVNISSIHSTQTKSNFVAYATTKAALSSLTRNMVLDLGSRIRINAIEPAAIATDMLKAGFVGKEGKYQELEAHHPIGRVGTPEEVAKLAVFLSSGEAGFVQGACISASGGIGGCLSDPA